MLFVDLSITQLTSVLSRYGNNLVSTYVN